MEDKNLPDFIIIGAMKAGTTSLHDYLSKHPDFLMSKPKELNFFVRSLNWSKGLEWYKSHFNGNYKFKGETSPNYSKWPASSELMYSILPDVKLIYIIRNPVDRFQSHCLHQGYDPNSLIEVLPGKNENEKSVFETGKYYEQICYYLRFFNKSQIHVVQFEKMKSSPASFLADIFNFLGADGSKFPFHEFEFNASHVTRKKSIPGNIVLKLNKSKFYVYLKGYIVKWNFIYQLLKNTSNKLLYNKIRFIEIRQSSKNQLLNYYKDDIFKMDEMFGLQLSKEYGLTNFSNEKS